MINEERYNQLYRNAVLGKKPFTKWSASELVGYYLTKKSNWKGCLLHDIETFKIPSTRGYAALHTIEGLMKRGE